MSQINAHLTFNGNCREAMSFYKDCLGGELFVQTLGESPMEVPGMAPDAVMHACLKKDGIILMGSDMCDPEGFIEGNTVQMLLDCSSEDEIQTFFSKLSEGGQVNQPLQDAFWGATFGHLKDKFGKTWMLNYSKEQQ